MRLKRKTSALYKPGNPRDVRCRIQRKLIKELPAYWRPRGRCGGFLGRDRLGSPGGPGAQGPNQRCVSRASARRVAGMLTGAVSICIHSAPTSTHNGNPRHQPSPATAQRAQDGTAGCRGSSAVPAVTAQPRQRWTGRRKCPARQNPPSWLF